MDIITKWLNKYGDAEVEKKVEYDLYKKNKTCSCKLPSFKTTQQKIYACGYLCDDCIKFLTN